MTEETLKKGKILFGKIKEEEKKKENLEISSNLLQDGERRDVRVAQISFLYDELKGKRRDELSDELKLLSGFYEIWIKSQEEKIELLRKQFEEL